MDWFLYNKGLRHERVKPFMTTNKLFNVKIHEIENVYPVEVRHPT